AARGAPVDPLEEALVPDIAALGRPGHRLQPDEGLLDRPEVVVAIDRGIGVARAERHEAAVEQRILDQAAEEMIVLERLLCPGDAGHAEQDGQEPPRTHGSRTRSFATSSAVTTSFPRSFSSYGTSLTTAAPVGHSVTGRMVRSIAWRMRTGLPSAVIAFHRPAGSLPRITSPVCCVRSASITGSSSYAPSLWRSSSMSSCLPVRKYHPGPAPCASA